VKTTAEKIGAALAKVVKQTAASLTSDDEGAAMYRTNIKNVPKVEGLQRKDGWIDMQVQFLIDKKSAGTDHVVGWTVLGYGTSQLPLIRLPLERTRDFIKKGAETQKGIQAMDAAISELSLNCNPADARRALYLISAPSREMSVDMVKELGDYLRGLAPQAVIRNGDYPRQKGSLDVSVILSELSDVEKVRGYYAQSTAMIPRVKERQEETDIRLKSIEDASRDIPSLL